MLSRFFCTFQVVVYDKTFRSLGCISTNILQSAYSLGSDETTKEKKKMLKKQKRYLSKNKQQIFYLNLRILYIDTNL